MNPQCLASVLQPFCTFLQFLIMSIYMRQPRHILFLRFIQALQPWSEAICIREMQPLYFSSLIYYMSLTHSNQKANSFLTHQTYHAISLSELLYLLLCSAMKMHVSFTVYTTHPLLYRVPQVTQPSTLLASLAFILFCLVLQFAA